MTIYRFSSSFFAVKAAVVAQRLIGVDGFGRIIAHDLIMNIRQRHIRLFAFLLPFLGSSVTWSAPSSSALAYFEPTTNATVTAKTFTFTPIEIPDLKLALAGRWHVVAHCAGRPLPESWYVQTQTPGSLKTFLRIPEFTLSDVQIFQKKLDRNGQMQTRLVFAGPLNLTSLEDGWYTFSGSKIRPVKIEETGETAFESFGVYDECAPGILAKPIFLRDPTS